MANNRAQNKGWRLDYMLIDRTSLDLVEDSTIHNEYYGSDHCPIQLRINFNLKELTNKKGASIPKPIKDQTQELELDQEELDKIMCDFDDEQDMSMRTAKAEITENEDS